MGKVIKVRFRRHARASAAVVKSSAVTRLSVTAFTATAKSLDSHTLPRRNRDIVVRSHETPAARMREAIPSSSKPSFSMKTDNCMDANVHQAHRQVNLLCAPGSLEPVEAAVHNMHMAKRGHKHKQEQQHGLWTRTYLKEYRKVAGLSQSKAAFEMGLTGHSQLSRIEAGKQEYSQHVLEAASRLYSVSIWHLLYCPPHTPLPKALQIWTKSLE